METVTSDLAGWLTRCRPPLPAIDRSPRRGARSRPERRAEVAELQIGRRTLAYTVVRSARRRKTLTIAVDPGTGVRVAAPMSVPAAAIEALLIRRSDWILRRLDHTPAPAAPERRFADGEAIPYLGQPLRLSLEASASRRAGAERCGDTLRVHLPAGLAGEQQRAVIVQALERWYRARATEQFTCAVERWSGRLGAKPREVLVRAQRRRWGSCSAHGVLRLNWRLVMAPCELIDYVVVHELAHLRVPNHSPAFWAEVARVLPDWKRRRQRLNEIGPSLAL